MPWNDQEFSDLIDAIDSTDQIDTIESSDHIDAIDSTDHIDAIDSSGLIPEAENRGLLLDRVLGMLARGFIIVIPSLLGASIIAGTLDAMGFAPFLPTLLAATGLIVAIQALYKQR